ncbi:MAG: universal stress protein [Desulfobacteraceae bacterium]|nr:universal stress protein [Desulfobacteraceae bacterium]
MKYLVGYNGSPSSKRALQLACNQAEKADALVYVVYSMEGGSTETEEDIRKAAEALEEAKIFLSDLSVRHETLQLVRGFSPGEDLVKFAAENGINQIFLGLQKRSKAQKILLGSTAQYIILKAPCAVTTTK